MNILDTPGHQDFAEDTFRTLTAVDSAIIVVDGAKGVETQTRKLMTVCRMRKTPVIIFINKMDREGRDPFDLLDELEQELEIKVRPLSWPINQGAKFKGVYNIYEEKLDLFTPDKQRVTDKVEVDINSVELDERVGEENAAKLREDLELVEGVYPTFDVESYREAEVAPVFFGSALNNFGVQELLNCFVEIAPSPRPTKAEERNVQPEEPKFTGFIFKITANIDPNHRSCIAFCKVCSGQFRRNQPYLHVRQGKTMRFTSPTQFMAQRKSTVDEAWPGDIVGLPDTGGIFKIGDTLTEGEQLHFRGLPSFSPELFKYIENDDPMKAKQLQKGIDQLMDEGVAQLFVNQFNNRKIIGTVGQLQFEVIQYRLENEYNAKCRWEPVHLYKACWIESDDEAELENFKKRKYQYMAKDKDQPSYWRGCDYRKCYHAAWYDHESCEILLRNNKVKKKKVFIAQELRKKNIAEYLLYMWQIEDTIRAFDCSLRRVRDEYVARFDYSDEQKEEETDWFGNLIRMMNQEGCREKGHLQINKVTVEW